MLDDPELVKHFPPLLKALKARLKSLPKSIPLGNVLLAGEASLVRYFGDLEVDEGPAFTVNRQWEHAFQVSEEEQRKRKPPMASPSKGIFRCAVAGGGSASSMRETAQTELQVYFSGIYPMADDDDGILGWWKPEVVFNHNCPALVAIYQGRNAEEAWRRDISRHLRLRHPSVIQLFGTELEFTVRTMRPLHGPTHLTAWVPVWEPIYPLCLGEKPSSSNPTNGENKRHGYAVQLVISASSSRPVGFLFLCPAADLQSSNPTRFRIPVCATHWSLGVDRISIEETQNAGFPTWELKMESLGTCSVALSIQGFANFTRLKASILTVWSWLEIWDVGSSSSTVQQTDAVDEDGHNLDKMLVDSEGIDKLIWTSGDAQPPTNVPNSF
ncbi:hypothetical protein DFH09DRAFT_1073050 [Mycena vulgaris]|nr:hypothetical protein DFH09DRAFT_1073050 [Mycena vulgaris]